VNGEGQGLLGVLGQRQIGRGADALQRDPVAEQLVAQLLDVAVDPAQEAGQTGSASRSIPSSRCSVPIARLDERLAS